MKIPCEIANLNTLKKGMKITLAVDEKNTPKVMKNIYSFMGKPIIVEFLIDEKEQMERLKMISPEQRKKIYAIFKDIASYTGDTLENIKENMKILFIQNTQYEQFSLSNCSSELASDFIEFLIRFCFENGVELSEHPKETLEDIESYLRMCIEYKLCAVCGSPGEIHHWQAIGMGRDRTKVDDSGHEKICLCRKHHSEVHQIGREAFKEKYHVYGVIE